MEIILYAVPLFCLLLILTWFLAAPTMLLCNAVALGIMVSTGAVLSQTPHFSLDLINWMYAVPFFLAGFNIIAAFLITRHQDAKAARAERTRQALKAADHADNRAQLDAGESALDDRVAQTNAAPADASADSNAAGPETAPRDVSAPAQDPNQRPHMSVLSDNDNTEK